MLRLRCGAARRATVRLRRWHSMKARHEPLAALIAEEGRFLEAG